MDTWQELATGGQLGLSGTSSLSRAQPRPRCWLAPRGLGEGPRETAQLHPVAPVGRRQGVRTAEERGRGAPAGHLVGSSYPARLCPVGHGSHHVWQLRLEVSPGSVVLCSGPMSHRLSHLSTSAHGRRKNTRSPGDEARLPPVRAGPGVCVRARARTAATPGPGGRPAERVRGEAAPG